MLATHVNHAEIGVRSTGLRIDLQDCPEIALRFVQLSVRERLLSELKKFCWIGWFCVLATWGTL